MKVSVVRNILEANERIAEQNKALFRKASSSGHQSHEFPGCRENEPSGKNY